MKNTLILSSTSPSVYVAFRSLQATDLCGQVGKIYNSTTIAFSENALSTGPASYERDTSLYGATMKQPPYFRQATWEDQ